MANCPNCGAPLTKDGVCAACGYVAATKPENVDKLLKLGKFSEASIIVNETLIKDPNNGKACLDMVRILTKNFTEKPIDKNQCLDYAVLGLTYANTKEKANIEFKLLAYFENLYLGGRGVENVFDIKATVSGSYSLRSSFDGTDAYASVAGAGTSSKAGKNPKAKKPRKQLTKKQKIIRGISCLLVVAVASTFIGVLVSRNKKPNYTNVTFDKGGGHGGQSSAVNYQGKTYYSVSIPYKEGYRFDGYYTSYWGAGHEYYDKNGDPTSSTWTCSESNLTLYACWLYLS